MYSKMVNKFLEDEDLFDFKSIDFCGLSLKLHRDKSDYGDRPRNVWDVEWPSSAKWTMTNKNIYLYENKPIDGTGEYLYILFTREVGEDWKYCINDKKLFTALNKTSLIH